jgi:hypothetical protein
MTCKPRLQAGDGDDMVKVMGCDDVNSVQVACLFFQHRFVVGVNAGAFALKAFNPVGELLSVFPNGVAKGDDFQLVWLHLVDLLVTPQVGSCDATTTHHRQPHRSLTVTHRLIPLASIVHPLFMTIGFGDSGALQEHDGVTFRIEVNSVEVLTEMLTR